MRLEARTIFITKSEKLELSGRVDLYVHGLVDSGLSAKLDQVLAQLNVLKTIGERIMATEQQMVDALNAIDAATTKVSDNLTAISGVVTTISSEVDALVAALQAAGVSQALIDQATALGTKASAASAATDALVPVLQAIASKGVLNPVPVPVPPPPPPPPPA